MRLLWVLAITCALCGCGRDDGKAAQARSALLVASGDTAGWIMPCGCTANQSGGLLRRATYLSDLRNNNDVLYVEVGGAAAGSSDYQKVKFEAILTGEKQMQIAAHNLGRAELAFGAAYLRDAANRSGVPIISANAINSATNQPIAPAYRIVELAGKKIAIVGVVSAQFAQGDVRVGDPKQAVLATVAPLKGQYESLIVLAYVAEQELEQLAAALPEADVVLGGPSGQAIAPRKVGPTLLAAATNKGKFLVQIERDPSGAWINGRIAEMNPSFKDDSQQVANLQAYLAELERRNFTADQSGLAPTLPPNAPSSYRVSGSASCVSCHKNENDSWVHSRHAHAWDSIEQKKFHVDPYCMQCHTTGFGMPGGFVSRTQSLSLTSVGCESCHGPSQAHVDQPKTRTTFAAADQCLRCHDHENSPNFAYPRYWPRIEHGRVMSSPLDVRQ